MQNRKFKIILDESLKSFFMENVPPLSSVKNIAEWREAWVAVFEAAVQLSLVEQSYKQTLKSILNNDKDALQHFYNITNILDLYLEDMNQYFNWYQEQKNNGLPLYSYLKQSFEYSKDEIYTGQILRNYFANIRLEWFKEKNIIDVKVFLEAITIG